MPGAAKPYGLSYDDGDRWGWGVWHLGFWVSGVCIRLLELCWVVLCLLGEPGGVWCSVQAGYSEVRTDLLS